MIGIIDYNMGNVQSVLNAFECCGTPAQIVTTPEALNMCDKIVLPGVGAFGVGMRMLRERGFDEALKIEVIKQKKPFLGICLGMQLICAESFEFGHHKGLGWLDTSVRRIPEGNGLRIPHVGWNDIKVVRSNRLLDPADGLNVYFVHSFYVDSRDPNIVTATCQYGIEFAVMLETENICVAQFHPEKSQKIGLGILKRFAEIKEGMRE